MIGRPYNSLNFLPELERIVVFYYFFGEEQFHLTLFHSNRNYLIVPKKRLLLETICIAHVMHKTPWLIPLQVIFSSYYHNFVLKIQFFHISKTYIHKKNLLTMRRLSKYDVFYYFFTYVFIQHLDDFGLAIRQFFSQYCRR